MPTYVTQSVADTSGFIPQIWAQEALPILRQNIILSKVVARDSDFGDFSQFGKSLNIGYAGVFTAQDKTANTLLNASVPTGGVTTTVTLNKYKVVPFVIENIAQAQSNQDLMRRYLEPAIVALAEQVETDLILAANSFSAASVGTIGTDLTSAVIRGAAQKLNSAKAPQSDRHLVFSPKDLSALEADSTLASYFNFNPINGVVEQGQFKNPLYGFTPHMSALTQTTSGGHAVQSLTVNGAPTGGTFTLTYSGQTTAAIAFNASAATVEAAIQALSTVGAGMARVSGANGGPWTVVLYVAAPVAFTHTDSFTGGTTPSLAVADSALTATSNLAFHKNAIILATRPVKNQGGATVMSSSIQDPDSGLILNLEAQYNAQAMGLWVNASILYGVATLRPDQGVVALA